jgi:acetyltransferase-like isoleucine patch superfamily enzyme
MADYFVHERAWCESSFIGKDTRIWAFSHVMKGAQIGSGCNICEHCFIENDVKIGNDVTVKNGISIWDGITIEDKVFLGPHMVFTNDFKPRSKVHDYVQLKTLVKKGATLGANVTVVGGITIGEYAMAGAGSVLTRSIPSYAMFYGNPAKFRYWICECTEKLNFINDRSECACGRKYVLIDGSCEVLI